MLGITLWGTFCVQALRSALHHELGEFLPPFPGMATLSSLLNPKQSFQRSLRTTFYEERIKRTKNRGYF